MVNMPIGPERRERLRRMLLEQREVVQKEVDAFLARRSREQQVQWQESVPDPGDIALRGTRDDEYLSILEARNRVRRQYDEALQRLDEGTYGICELCRNEISEERLKVLPVARTCKACQEREEAIEALEKEADRRQI